MNTIINYQSTNLPINVNIININHININYINQILNNENLQQINIFYRNLINDFNYTQYLQERQERIENTIFEINCVFEEKEEEEQEEPKECSICYEITSHNKFVELNCTHKFCHICITKLLQTSINKKICCAFCRKNVTQFTTHNLEIQEELELHLNL
jgi:hypothetical protein